MSTPVASAPAVRAGDSPAEVRRLVLNAGSLVGAYVVPRACMFAAVAIAARVLGVADFGAYGTAAAFAVILGILASLGMLPLLVREIARAPERASALVGAAHGVKAVSAAAMLGLLLLLAGPAFGYPPTVFRAAILLGIGYVVRGFAETLGAYFHAVERMGVWMQANALYGMTAGLLGILLVVATRDVVWFCAAIAIGEVAALAWLLVRAPRDVALAVPFRAAAAVRRLFAAALPFAAAFIALTVYSKVDVVLLAAWRGDVEVGLYTAAYKFVDAAHALAIACVAALYPRLARRVLTARPGERWAGTRVVELALIGVVPAAGALWLLREPVVHLLFGPAFTASASVLALLAVALPALAVNVVGGYVLAAAGRMGYVAALYAAALLLKVALNAAWTPAMGALGAALAMLASELALVAGMVFVLHRVVAAAPGGRVLGSALAGAALCAVLATTGPLGAVLYVPAVALVYWRTGVLAPTAAVLVQAART